MKEKIILILKGFIVGLGKVIPGVSGAMLAITLGIYDKCIEAISNFTKRVKDNILLLFYIGIGLIMSIGLFSNMVIYLLNNHYFLTMCFFIGLIIGGLPKMYSESKVKIKNIKNIAFIIITFFIMVLVTSVNANYTIKMEANFISLIGLGFLEAFAMVVPGISGTALLMLVGYYDLVILRFSQILNIMTLFETIEFFIPFGLGMLLGVLIISKIINYFFKVHPIETYCIIFGLILSSIYMMFNIIIKVDFSLYNLLIGCIFIIIGGFVSYILEHSIGK